MEKKRIDEIFKNGLTENEPPYEEAHWLAMEQKLAAHHAKKIRKIWLISLSSAAAILLGLFLTVWQPITREESGLRLVNERRKPIGVAPVRPEADHETEKIVAGEKIIAKQQKQELANLSDKRVARHYGNSLLTAVKVIKPLMDSGEKHLTLPDFQVTPPQLMVENRSTISREKRKQHSYLSIMAAPDLTGVQGANNNEVSPNIGVLYTMPLGNKWSVSGGLVYAKKNYNAPFSFYRPKTPGNWSVPPNRVDAVCDVLDIPVEINYQLYQKGNTQLKLSAGASSYFMLREQYQFTYGEPNGGYGDDRNLPALYEVRRQNNHLLGVANIAVSLERSVSDNMSVSVRPFVKLPLTGVGYGQTRLESKGLAVFFNFKVNGK